MKIMTKEELKNILDNSEECTLVDVRSPEILTGIYQMLSTFH